MWPSTAVLFFSTMALFLHPTGSLAEMSPMIVGGQNAADGQFPWMVAIYDKNQFRCSATLISNRYILTAAHCFFSNKKLQDSSDFHGNAGSFNMSNPRMRLRFERIFIHPNYSSTNCSNDIALVKTTSRISFNSLMQPLCLLSEHTKLKRNHRVVAVGWGEVGPKDSVLEGILQFVRLKVVRKSRCSIAKKTSPSVICAAGFKKGPWIGDSGGPLIAFDSENSPVLVGVTSNLPSPPCGEPSVYMRVTHYRNFIYRMADDFKICSLSNRNGNPWNRRKNEFRLPGIVKNVQGIRSF